MHNYAVNEKVMPWHKIHCRARCIHKEARLICIPSNQQLIRQDAANQKSLLPVTTFHSVLFPL